MNFDFEQLHWQEFERLVGFYLKSVIGEGISLFDGSRDKGRDATFSGTSEAFPSSQSQWHGDWIFQVKHRTTRNSTLSKIETKLQSSLKSELVKIFKTHEFNCDNYLYITNINISNSFRDQTTELFQQFCNENKLQALNFHVIDYNDLEKFVSSNRAVRYSFPSMLRFTDLEKLFLRKEEIKNKGFLKAAVKTVNHFVSTSHFQDAITLIDNNDLLMLVGNPKSGKTSIIESIALCYVSEGNYKPYFIRNTDEFFTITAYLDESEKALFICDDIFGIHELDEAKLKDWTDYFQSVLGSLTGGHKFLFTTRRYIFEEFARKSNLRSIFPNEEGQNKFVLRLKELTLEERTQILEKHLENSKLSSEKVELIHSLKSNILLSKDFSPEVIRSLIQIVLRTNKNLHEAIIDHINNPNQYLYDFFENMAEQKRLLLLSLTVSPVQEMKEVERTFNILLNDTHTQPEITFHTFVNEIENSIVKKRDYAHSSDLDFYHPTMYDVIFGIFKRDQHYRSLMLSNANVELISLLTVVPLDRPTSNKLEISVDEIKNLVRGIERFLGRITNLNDIIRLVTYFESINIETAQNFAYFTPMKQVSKSIRIGISSQDFFARHSNSRIEQWLQLLDKWAIINGNEIPLYLVEIEKVYYNPDTFDYWRLIFLLEHIKNGFIEETVPLENLQIFINSLSIQVKLLRVKLQMKNGRPYTEEDWLPKFNEVNDLVIKMKKSQLGRRILNDVQEDWEMITKWSTTAKNRHSGLIGNGSWARRFSKLGNYPKISDL
ncbi:MAG: hypothetical protein RLP44_20865 [Aggregatilineales bacterium]